MQTFFDDSIDIHHIFPQAWCISAQIDADRYNSIINKTAISARTNRIIGGQAPSRYLAKLEEDANLNQSELSSILETHGIDPTLLYGDNFDECFAQRGRALVALIEDAMGKPVAQEGADFLRNAVLEVYEDEMQDWEEVEIGVEMTEDKLPIETLPVQSESTEVPATIAQTDPLEKRFNQAMLDIYKAAKRDTGYTATYFLQ
jgi:hypothetical protein